MNDTSIKHDCNALTGGWGGQDHRARLVFSCMCSRSLPANPRCLRCLCARESSCCFVYRNTNISLHVHVRTRTAVGLPDKDSTSLYVINRWVDRSIDRKINTNTEIEAKINADEGTRTSFVSCGHVESR